MPEGSVIRICICPDQGEPMSHVSRVEVLAYKGIIGDRYAAGRGAFSRSRPPKVRDVSLIAIEAIEAANKEAPVPFTDLDTRRNIVTLGIVDLNQFVGKEFMVGNVRMLGTARCDPCARPSMLSGKPGFATAFKDRGGLRAQVLNDGEITVGDPIVMI